MGLAPTPAQLPATAREEPEVRMTCMGLFLSSSRFGCSQFFVRSGKAVFRPVACNQVREARGRGQGTETVAKLSGLPLSGACVSQRLDA